MTFIAKKKNEQRNYNKLFFSKLKCYCMHVKWVMTWQFADS